MAPEGHGCRTCAKDLELALSFAEQSRSVLGHFPWRKGLILQCLPSWCNRRTLPARHLCSVCKPLVIFGFFILDYVLFYLTEVQRSFKMSSFISMQEPLKEVGSYLHCCLCLMFGIRLVQLMVRTPQSWCFADLQRIGRMITTRMHSRGMHVVVNQVTADLWALSFFQ